MKRTRPAAFTLVELLVVIGIIAVLVGLLMPALTGARKQAIQIKCAAALREIGNAYQMYAQENNQYMPPVRINRYDIDGIFYDFSAGADNPPTMISNYAYWYNFLAKYLTNMKTGVTLLEGGDAGNVTSTVLYGCPAFEPYTTANDPKNIVGGINRQYTGYGMNPWPRFDELETPAPGANFPPQWTDFDWDTYPNQDKRKRWYKVIHFRKPSDRALVGDAYWWKIEAKAGPADGTAGPQKNRTFTGSAYSSGNPAGQTTFDFYRHGKDPREAVSGAGGYFERTGGKVAYNVMFCDGHVETMTDREQAYRITRMRFPG